MADEQRHTEFMGTPIECEAWLRKFFDSIRTFLRSSVNCGDINEVANDVFERTVWTIEISGLDAVLPAKVRDDPSLRMHADKIDIERDLFSLVTSVDDITENETVDIYSDKMSSEATDLEG